MSIETQLAIISGVFFVVASAYVIITSDPVEK